MARPQTLRIALVGALVMAATISARGQVGCGIAGAPPPLCPPVVYRSGPQTRKIGLPPGMDRYRRSKERADLRQLKKETAELSALVHRLRTEVDKANENSLSLTVIRETRQIEKLAKKIQKLVAHG